MDDQPRPGHIFKWVRSLTSSKGGRLKKQISEEDIKTLIDEGNEKGVIDATAKEMLYSVFSFDDKTAIEIMTPRATVYSIDLKKDNVTILNQVMDKHFSRIPVYKEEPHNVIGILHAKELYEAALKCGIEKVDIESLVRPAYYVPETKSIDTLFKELQSTKNNMAMILDEYGDFQGIITIEDIVSQIVGDLLDEHQTHEEIAKIDEHTYLVDGLAHIEDVNKKLGLEIECEHFDTIGGFVVHLIGWIPKQSISVTYKNITFEVAKVKSNRVEQLKIYLANQLAI
ncbi:hemolysin family protein [Niameybacter massiliensis]|uniref:Hemolysin family protein n=1 Tax=Holtiella tumoricola TaxID=3018743 RepID=A0AA42DKP9_9FIRM|nr:hemolysin family protein [Niameybacter massiliensis]MDA3730748.1 hemolysin family protein [Holtiella tumoricola]